MKAGIFCLKDREEEELVTKADMRNNHCSDDSRPDRVSFSIHEPLRKWDVLLMLNVWLFDEAVFSED
jgi:hypothetical protein